MRKQIFTILFIFLNATHTIAAQNMTISNEGSHLSLLAFDVLSVAYSKLNIHLDYIKTPAERSLWMSNTGKTIGESARSKGIEKKYKNLIMISVPVAHVDLVGVSKSKKKIKINGWQSLQPYTIGLRRGVKYLEKKTKGMRVQPVANIKQMLQKVATGRNDVAIMSRIAALVTMKEESITGLTILEPPLERINLYHYLHKSKKHLLNDITKILQEMEASGEIQKIQQKSLLKILK